MTATSPGRRARTGIPFAIPALVLLLAALAAAQGSLDPRQHAVPLPAAPGWNASLLYEGDAGIWALRSAQVFERFGCPEVIALDDRGRCTVLVGYSGKWTPVPSVQDGAWLGTLVHDDIDPHIPGPELYTGGVRGNLYRLVPHHQIGFDTDLIAHLPGEEIHAMVAGDLDTGVAGRELLVFTRSGAVFALHPRGESDGAVTLRRIGDVAGRIRDAVVLSDDSGASPWIAAALRSGSVTLLRLGAGKLERRDIVSQPMGFGRVARRAGRAGEPLVLYASRDDGVILRISGTPAEGFSHEVIYAGPQGPRGLVSGRFFEDPDREAVAVFGYSKRVEILARTGSGRWEVEQAFEDRDAGHWLSVAELDGRNGTDEIIGSGYGKRVFMLSRPPGYGLPGVAADPEQAAARPTARAPSAVPRVAILAGRAAVEELSPLSYRGGFETKTLVYETLVRRDAEGRIAPGLASAWFISEDGLRTTFTLREGARWHDGTPVRAEDLRIHFKRWVGLPEHDWLGANRRIQTVEAPSAGVLRITVDRPYALLPDLCAINPCALRAPSSLDREGHFVRPVGSGPFAFAGAEDGGRRLLLRRADAAAKTIELIRFDAPDADPLAALLRGEVDVVPGGWLLHLPRERIGELRRDPALRVLDAPGSSVHYLSFSLSGPTRKAGLRRRVAAAIDHAALIRTAALGFADPCTAWAAPSVRFWPRRPLAPARRTPHASPWPPLLLRLIVREGVASEQALARAVADQLDRAGIPVTVWTQDSTTYLKSLEDGTYDLRIERTWGVPYDPYLSLVSRFLPPPSTRHAAAPQSYGIDPRLQRLVEKATATPIFVDRVKVYAEIQTLMDSEALIVPLYVPHRLAVMRADLPPIPLDHDLYHLDLRPLTGG